MARHDDLVLSVAPVPARSHGFSGTLVLAA